MPRQLPHGEAPKVDMVGIQAGHATCVLKLDLDLPLVAFDWQLADGTRETDPEAAPGAIRAPRRKFAAPDRSASFLADESLRP